MATQVDRMQRKDGIRFHRGLPDPSHLTKWIGPTRGGVLVLDDLTEEVEQDKRVLDLSTKDSHHRNITVLYLTQDLFPPGKFSKIGPTRGGVLVLDDLTEEVEQDKRVLDLSTKDSHHRNITVLYLTQDLFPPGKFSKTINRNAHYIVAFKITHGIKRAYGPFYFKPFLTVGIKPCAYLNASRRALLDI